VSEDPNDLDDPTGLCGNGRQRRPCLPYIGTFVNDHKADAEGIAANMPTGVTPQEILAVSADETQFGDGFSDVGNYFGLHDKNPSWPGQDGWTPAKNDGHMATFPDDSGYRLSGNAFAQRVSESYSGTDSSDPTAFFSDIHSLGWGAGKKAKDYVKEMLSVFARIGDCL
jgi:hypothetical protein